LRVLHLHGQTERRKEAAREQLDALGFVEVTRAWEESLEAVLIFFHRRCPAARRQLEQRSRSEGGPETQIQELLETRPRWGALVSLELHVPELRSVLKVVRRHPDPFFWYDPLLQEERLAPVEEDQWVALAVVVRKLGTPVLGRPILMVFAPEPWTCTRHGRASDGEVGDRLSVSLDRLLHQGD